MTRAEQIQFIHDLTNSITSKLIDSIQETELTKDWNGHELRAILAEKFQDATMAMTPRQKKEFKRLCIVANL